MSMLFAPSSSRIRTIPAGLPFLKILSAGLKHELIARGEPALLADTIIYVPNRRSARALAYSLFEANEEASLMLPDIRVLGDLETAEPPPSVEASISDLPPVIPPGRRLGELARLILAFHRTQAFDYAPSAALSTAEELAQLLDQSALSGNVDWQQLDALVLDQDLAIHWQKSVAFLKIIYEQWPQTLSNAKAMDPYTRRLAAATAMAEAWGRQPPRGPLIIAGSTGSTPASRVLMQAALDAPRGLVVLPGLDCELSLRSQSRILSEPNHPQFSLLRTLEELNFDLAHVEEWPDIPDNENNRARRQIISESLAPAEDTAAWNTRLQMLTHTKGEEAFIRDALDGLSHIEAADETEEAELATLLLRQTFEKKGQTAALVTPDTGLARRVSAQLKKYGIICTPSAGTALHQTPAGSLVLLVADWLLDPGDPVRLMALLKHPLSCLDASAVLTLDRHALRGPRNWTGMTELVGRVQATLASDFCRASPDDAARALSLARHVAMLADKAEVAIGERATSSGPEVLAAILELCSAFCDPPQPWTGEAGEALSSLFDHLADMTGPIGTISLLAMRDIIRSEMTKVFVPPETESSQIAIWGPLEARLQSADHIILAGLNEGLWPAQPGQDSFLPRKLRREIGLSDPDERIGLSAHDFAQFACAPHVTMLYAKRRDDAPALASRWIWRMRMLARGALGENRAAALLAPDPANNPKNWTGNHKPLSGVPSPASVKPQPKPPVSTRPKRLSVTRIETLIRDPYSIYCRYILGLERLDPLDSGSDPRRTGSAIHSAIEYFEADGQHQSSDAFLAKLEAELMLAGLKPADLISLRHARLRAIHSFMDWHRNTVAQISGGSKIEADGRLELNLGTDIFTLTGKADRIDEYINDEISIIDFKSGKPPTKPQVMSGLEPQLPLLGLIAQKGQFDGLARHRKPTDFTYIRIGTDFEISTIADGDEAQTLIDATEAGLLTLLKAFADPNHPYLNAPRPERLKYELEYNRLSRRVEWAGFDEYD